MTAKEMKIKTFSLIEELYPEEKGLAEDEDVLNKINGVINQIQMDLMPYRKINASIEVEVKKDDDREIDLSSLIDDLYQINRFYFNENVDYEMPNDTTIILPKDYEGTFKIYYYKYPELMKLEFNATDTQTKEEVAAEYDKRYEFELDPDVLEVAPYGIASILLKMDMISNYGQYFKMEYDARKAQIDPRKTSGIINIVGGYDI